jgi:uncharacterized peroxidase-related enzyme
MAYATREMTAVRKPRKTVPNKTVLKKRTNPTKHAPVGGGKKSAAAPKQGAEDDTKFMALEIARGKLSDPMETYFAKCEEKLGYVPNVLRAFGFDNGKLQAFVDYRQQLVQNAENLSKLEIEMIATVVSAQNRCFYCITVHGNGVRALSEDPILGEMMVMNYRAAKLSKRHRAMLDFAVKLTVEPWAVEEKHREKLRSAGFSDRDIWDIAAVAAFYNMTNRLASATDMRPNTAYHGQAR